MIFKRTTTLLANIMLGFILSSLLFGCTEKPNTIGSPMQYIGSSDDKKEQITNDQIKQIQQQIDILERDFRAIEPNIQNLVAIESDIQTLIAELSKLTDPVVSNLSTPTVEKDPTVNENVDAPAIPDLAPTKTQTENTQAPTPLTTEDNKDTIENLDFPHEITNVRFGNFNAGTRLVVDFAQNSEMNYDISKDGDDILIAFEKTKWKTDKSWKPKKEDLITGYEATQMPEKSVMRIKTNGDDMTVKVFTLPAANPGKGPRLVLDFNAGITS